MIDFLEEIGKFIFGTKYAKYNEKEKRRETWQETVSRYMDFMRWHLKENQSYNMPDKVYKEVHDAICEHRLKF